MYYYVCLSLCVSVLACMFVMGFCVRLELLEKPWGRPASVVAERYCAAVIFSTWFLWNYTEQFPPIVPLSSPINNGVSFDDCDGAVRRVALSEWPVFRIWKAGLLYWNSVASVDDLENSITWQRATRTLTSSCPHAVSCYSSASMQCYSPWTVPLCLSGKDVRGSFPAWLVASFSIKRRYIHDLFIYIFGDFLLSYSYMIFFMVKNESLTRFKVHKNKKIPA